MVTVAPEIFLKTLLNSIARKARSPELNLAKKPVGSRSRRSQTAGIKAAETRPSMRRTRSPWIAWKIAAANGKDDQETAHHAQAREIGLGNDLVDEDAGRDRDRQARAAPRAAPSRTPSTARAPVPAASG